jgi:phage regulator Rha-like protein
LAWSHFKCHQDLKSTSEIDRAGSTLLAMGFTGKQALQFKIPYIDAFSAAEKALTAITAIGEKRNISHLFHF